MTKDKKNNSQIELGILRIADLGFSVDESMEILNVSDLGYNLNIIFNSSEDWIEFTITAMFRHAESHKPFLTSNVLTRFFVKDLKGFETVELGKKSQLNLPDEIMVTLFSIAFTHTRAMHAKNSAGTKFNRFHIPIINPSEILKELLAPET